MRRFLALCALTLSFWMPSNLWAVEPDEILDDPVLEERARTLSKGLRCLVCRNESIDESHADLAKDMRILLREQLVAGASDAEALEFLVTRYGEYVLLTPRRDGANLLLWAAGPAMALLGLLSAGLYMRSRRPVEAERKGLSEAEQSRLAELLDDKSGQ